MKVDLYSKLNINNKTRVTNTGINYKAMKAEIKNLMDRINDLSEKNRDLMALAVRLIGENREKEVEINRLKNLIQRLTDRN